MNLNMIKKVATKVVMFKKEHAAAILTGVAVVGLVSTAVYAYKAGKKVDTILAKHKEKIKEVDGNDEKEKEVFLETAKELTPVVLPPVVLGVASVGAILGSHSVSNRKIAALSAAYSISETALKDVEKKMRTVLGDKKTQSIKEAIMKDKMEDDAKEENGKTATVVITDGDVLCKDLYTGRYFSSNANKIGKAINWASYEVQSSMYVSLNEFYEQLGIDTIPLGSDLGWNVDDLVGGTLPISYTAILSDDDKPCLCIDYVSHLRKDYQYSRQYSIVG